MMFSYVILAVCLLLAWTPRETRAAPGDLGEDCDSSGNCTPDGSVCVGGGTGVCICRAGLVTQSGDCVCGDNAGAGFPGGACDGYHQCTNDPKAICATVMGADLCGCPSGWAIIQGQCIRGGVAGGRCVSGACFDKFAECTAGMCMCVSGASQINGMCRVLSEAGGGCDGEIPCNAKNTRCNRNVRPSRCDCVGGYRLINGMCVRNGALGGRCRGGSCPEEKNAHCIKKKFCGNVCMCNTDYTAFEGRCVRDGAFGGICIAGVCPNDKFAECDTSTTPPMCMCITGTQAIAGVCRRDGFPGAFCLAGDLCLDKHSDCNTTNNMCMCYDHFENIGGSCIQVGSAGGRCYPAGRCMYDKNAECIMNFCMCVTRSSLVSGMCRLDGLPGGYCDGLFNDECSRDKNAVCVNGMCMCREETTKQVGTSKLHGAMCIEDERLGGQCAGTNGTWCKGDKNAICLEGMCMCRDGSTPSGGWCVHDGYPGAACASGQCDKWSTCDATKGMCVCTGIDYVAVGGRCHHTGGNYCTCTCIMYTTAWIILANCGH